MSDTPFGHEYGEGMKLSDLMAALDTRVDRRVHLCDPLLFCQATDARELVRSVGSDCVFLVVSQAEPRRRNVEGQQIQRAAKAAGLIAEYSYRRKGWVVWL